MLRCLWDCAAFLVMCILGVPSVFDGAATFFSVLCSAGRCVQKSEDNPFSLIMSLFSVSLSVTTIFSIVWVCAICETLIKEKVLPWIVSLSNWQLHDRGCRPSIPTPSSRYLVSRVDLVPSCQSFPGQLLVLRELLLIKCSSPLAIHGWWFVLTFFLLIYREACWAEMILLRSI